MTLAAAVPTILVVRQIREIMERRQMAMTVSFEKSDRKFR
jgi:hypothetical protein